MPEFLIRVRPNPGSDVPDALRLRQLLKRLGRRHGLSAVDVREVPAKPAKEDECSPSKKQ
jgi:hypothetical protein